MSPEIIIKFFLPRFSCDCFNELKPIKLVFPTTLPVKGRVYNCENYESRSGLHWDICYNAEFKRIHGPVRLLRRLVRYQPSEILQSNKESKNLVGLHFMKKEAVEKIAELYMLDEDKDYLIITNSDWIEVWEYRPFDKYIFVKPQPLYTRDNLRIYSIPIVPRWIEYLMWTVDRAATLEDYVFVANDNFKHVRSERRIGKKMLEAMMLYIPENTDIKLIDRDYRILDLNLEPGLYLVTLLRDFVHEP